MIKKPTVIVLKQFFGLKPGQKLKEFADEVKTLTQAEREELADLVEAETGEQA